MSLLNVTGGTGLRHVACAVWSSKTEMWSLTDVDAIVNANGNGNINGMSCKVDAMWHVRMWIWMWIWTWSLHGEEVDVVM